MRRVSTWRVYWLEVIAIIGGWVGLMLAGFKDPFFAASLPVEWTLLVIWSGLRVPAVGWIAWVLVSAATNALLYFAMIGVFLRMMPPRSMGPTSGEWFSFGVFVTVVYLLPFGTTVALFASAILRLKTLPWFEVEQRSRDADEHA